jgi:hypothetical protein
MMLCYMCTCWQQSKEVVFKRSLFNVVSSYLFPVSHPEAALHEHESVLVQGDVNNV